MNVTIRKILTASGPSRRLYYAAREAYHTRRVLKVAGRYFLNANEFRHVLGGHGAVTTPFDLRTSDGLTITIRRNYGDAMTVAEIFVDNCYVRGLAPPHNYPVVIDIGGFIGDFSLYAVKRLGARKVIVCEPSPGNWALLLKNIANNHYEDRIEPVNMAVTDGEEVMMNVAAPDESQCMVSAYCQDGQPTQAVPGISLSQLLQDHSVDAVDLLKIDCEGGEYPILLNTPSEVYSRIRNIVFEYHDIEGGWAKLEQVKKRLHVEGYSLRTGRGLVSASRA